jgi:hypothetical protein
MLPGMRQRTRVNGRWMGGGWSGDEEMGVGVVVVVDSGQNRLEDQRQLNGASALITLCSLSALLFRLRDVTETSSAIVRTSRLS